MNPQIFERIAELIAARTGLQVRAKDQADWTAALETRRRACRLDSPRAYLERLESEAVDAGEWRQLLPHLTNGESYFLRDKSQFALLRNQILPDLLASRRAERSLRIWSAGCSTGEEPYSLAMLLRELVPPDWKVSIWGTDVNAQSLQKARLGQYAAWSFRAVDADLLARYFNSPGSHSASPRPLAHRGATFELKPEIRALVRFETDNLCDAQRSNPDLCDMDLILCRNVLIYFRREAIARALSRFGNSLREGGYLLTGHAELHHHDPAPLVPRIFPESVIYQKPKLADSSRTAPRRSELPASFALQMPLGATANSPTFAPQPRTLVATRTAIVPARKPMAPLSTELSSPISSPRIEETATAALLCRRARQSADAGQHEAAIRFCAQALEADAAAVEAYLIWAQVAGEQNRHDEAKNLLKKAIYLQPSGFEAYLELGALYADEGDAPRARRMHFAALDNLRDALEKLESSANAAEIATQMEERTRLETIAAHLETRLSQPEGAA